ncbi:MAG TPA: protein-L-isoaspartate O-methyltransferase [Steroidobacteraceae bacterium]|jgi:protein-L-isoaspartate(D-aspartate) O-methyltransferase|nr:protein-L-isoaspartate O-methyltransferase [Steroidobacteraceae bacterium]HSY46347.1 protein-L-isoaspartate O-methyltransferase [Steroidobacteraceae bacterium]
MQLADTREQMIEQQVRAWDVLDERVLAVLRQVPRELFTPDTQRYVAYADVEVPLAQGQHMLRPSVVGRLLQALLPAAAEQVLEIGAGSGFVSACLRVMASRVTSLELYPELAEAARRNLALLGMRDVAVVDADALAGGRGERYDVIAMTASLPLYDERFEQMLNIGGRLFVTVGMPPVMDARLVRRTAEDSFVVQSLFETVIDPLVHAARPPAFTF